MRVFDADEATEINAEQWQIDLLALNPAYVYWGPHEDSMGNDSGGWRSRMIFESWPDFGPWNLDELNECVNFYFEVNRACEDCQTCGGNGYHKDSQTVVNGFYAHMNDAGEHWNDKITQDEVQALLDDGRLGDFTNGKPSGYVPSAAEVNAAQGRGFLGHDGINRMILTRARLRRLGLPINCDTCDGNGYVYTAPDASVSLILWWLHPRKGCSRGIEVKNVRRDELPAIFTFLRSAANRNAERFSKIASI